MILSWLSQHRRRRLLAQPFPGTWRDFLQRNLAHYPRLAAHQQEKLRRDIQVFVAEKHWVGCGGLDVSEEMKVTIAGQACWMLVGIEEGYYFDGVKSILLYPSAYAHPAKWQSSHLIVQESLPVLGESWGRGPVVLAWDVVVREGRDARCPSSLVIHEFAHHLDGLDGEMGGTPPLPHQEAWRWEQVVTQEYERLVSRVQRGLPTLLDPYGAADRTEFFAVASECFFRQPGELKQQHDELYRLLSGFYRFDPADLQGPQ